MKIKFPPGATPVNDSSGLIPEHLKNNREQLWEWEQDNILKAREKFLTKIPKTEKWLTVDFIKSVHRSMFDETWEWAGQFRKTELNLGINSHQIPEALKNLCHDVEIWPKDSFGLILENAVRLHYRLTHIHPFKDGNGRHARLLADIYLKYHGYDILPWGGPMLYKNNSMRNKYIAALKKADNGDISELVLFAQETSET